MFNRLRSALSMDESARYIGFSPPTIRKWCVAGLLRGQCDKRRGFWSLERSDLDAFAAKYGIDLDDARRYPARYTAASLAKASGVTAGAIRRLIDRRLLQAICIAIPGEKRSGMFIGHRVGQRFISDNAKRKTG